MTAPASPEIVALLFGEGGGLAVCEARVDVVAGRYPYKPACACGWVYPWGYVADHAARILADAHVAGELRR